jgi:hypothetical protein
VITRRPPAGRLRVRQAIFSGTAAADGARVTFVSLFDGRCALLRDGKLIAAWGSDVYGVDVGVREFLEVTEGEQPVAAAIARPHSRVRPLLRKGGCDAKS